MSCSHSVAKHIIFASNNLGKIREVQEIFSGTPYKILPQSEFSVPEIAEIGKTFKENALLKAFNVTEFVDLPVIADDSGLEIDALNGAPGIYSARYAGEKAQDADNVAKVLAALQDVPEDKRSARFRCVVVYLANAKATPIICEGVWEGRILFAPRGKDGFGYDPIFFVPIHNCSAAELLLEVKNKISHRGQALAKLIEEITKNQKSL